VTHVQAASQSHATKRNHTPTVNEVAGGQRTLHQGHQGPAVHSVQKLLNKHGAHLRPDGDFGPKTQMAVERFQRRHHLDVTGKVDHKTLDKLEGAGVHHKDELVERGDHGKQVLGIERGLRKLGYDTGEVDGTYDAKTAAAVRDFKHDQGHDGGGGSIDGAYQGSIRRELKKLDHAPMHTRVKPTKEHRRLDALTAREAKEHKTPFGDMGPFSPMTSGIGPGSDRRAIKNVQGHLKAAGYDPKHVNGRFDERTRTAVQAFQRASGLPVTGRVDERTWNKLDDAKMEAKNGTSPPQEMGERSRAVLHTERVMKRAGLKPGKVDGVFDRDTQAASRRFERRAHGRYGDDGRVGPGQLRAMEKLAKERTLGRDNRTAKFTGTWNDGALSEGKTGVITINGHKYAFKSGGWARGYLPPGTYTVGGKYHLPGDSFTRDGQNFAYAMTNKYDPRVGDTRSELLIHPDGGVSGTAGCIGMQGDARTLKRFQRDMAIELARNGGSFTLRVG
jgi:peptidoglycan hydrolase-like protein with peptidoglycan-binding domain